MNERKHNNFLLAFSIITLTTLFLCYFVFKPTAIEAQEPLEVITVVVKKGDSLWKIAERYDNNKIDLRKYIYIIQQYNNLENTLLQPGQRIKVPIYHTAKF